MIKNSNNNQNSHPKNHLQGSLLKFIQTLILSPKIEMPKPTYIENTKKLDSALKQRSINLFQCAQILKQILNSNQKIKQAISIAHEVIPRLLQIKVSHVLYHAYIYVMKLYKEYQKDWLATKEIGGLVGQIRINQLGYFCQAFDVAINFNKAKSIIEQLAKNGEYYPALKLAQSQHAKKQLIQIVESYVLNQKDKKLLDNVTEQIAKLGYTKQDFVRLHVAGLRSQMFQIYYNEGYQYAEEVFRYNPKIMTLIAERLIKDKKKQQVLAFCLRNPTVIPFLKDKNIQQQIKAQIQNINHFKQNSLLVDIFAPSDPKKYFSLPQFGILEKDVYFINSQTLELQDYLDDIVNSQAIGLDTQSYVARTKFCTDLELIATIQISNGKRAYIFDAKNIANPKIGQKLSKFFDNPNKIVVGHTLKQDLNVTLQALGILTKPQCKCQDVKDYFKSLYPGERAGLASISEKVLGKPICKNYTLTDWGRRPLLKNQVHYAALDAVVVIHIYQKLKSKKGFDNKKPNY